MIEGLSQRLREKRNQYGYSRKAVAENIGISDSTLADYENGHVEPSLKVLMKLAYKYNCTTDYLLGVEKPDAAILLDGTGLNPEQVDAVERLIHVMKQE